MARIILYDHMSRHHTYSPLVYRIQVIQVLRRWMIKKTAMTQQKLYDIPRLCKSCAYLFMTLKRLESSFKLRKPSLPVALPETQNPRYIAKYCCDQFTIVVAKIMKCIFPRDEDSANSKHNVHQISQYSPCQLNYYLLFVNPSHP